MTTHDRRHDRPRHSRPRPRQVQVRRLRSTTGDPAAATLPHPDHRPRPNWPSCFAQHRPAVVVIEACLLAGWVHDLCAERGLPCQVANTASEAWKFKHAKRKTDRDDALRLAQLYALGQLPTVTVPPPADTPVAGPDRLPPGPGRPPRGRAEPHPRDPRRPGPARPARRQGLDRARPGGHRPVRQAAGRRAAPTSCGAACSTWP